MRFPAKTPKIIQWLFPKFIWRIDTDKKELYLTFDDGPTPEITPWVLDQLKQYNAKATFFCIGDNIKKYPRIFKSIIESGHAIGNHTFHHLNGWKYKTSKYINDTKDVEHLVNFKFNLFRPPYGKLKPTQSKQLIKQGYKIIMWDVLSYDWDASVSEERCYNNVVKSATNGSVIVFHDSVKAEKNLKLVLPKVLEYFSENSFEFKAL